MTTSEARTPRPKLAFHGGLTGSLLPFVVFLTGVAWLGISGAPDERGFWPVLVLALATGVALARDRARYAEVVIRGMSQPLVALMILAWMLAGILASLLDAGGLLRSLVSLATAVGLSGGGFVAVSFLLACATSTATGTSLGTLLLVVPLLYPAGGALGAEPVFLLAALLAGATFGDNLSPISDTTIASANTQEAPMSAVVRSRLRYALPAGAAALVLYALLGADTRAPGAVASGEPAGLLPLLLLVSPVLVFVLLLRGRHLVVGMVAGAASAAAVGLVAGLLRLDQLLFIDQEAFVARGLLADGIERGIGVSIFTLLLMGLTAGIEATGVLERILVAARRGAQSARRAEAWIVAATSGVVLLTTHSVVAILTVGRFAKELGQEKGLLPERRANLLDVTVCTYPFLLPYFIPTLLAASLSQSGAEMGMPRVSPFQVGLANFHSWGLMLMLVVAVATGWGRRSG